jgi:hypothetical protein
MAKALFYETPGRVNKARGLNRARRKALLAAAGHELARRAVLMNVWTAATLQRFFAGPAAAPEHRYRAFADPPLRNCLRCSKIECSSS